MEEAGGAALPARPGTARPGPPGDVVSPPPSALPSAAPGLRLAAGHAASRPRPEVTRGGRKGKGCRNRAVRGWGDGREWRVECCGSGAVAEIWSRDVGGMLRGRDAGGVVGERGA